MNRQYPLPLPHQEARTADDFMVTASNQDAMGWLDRWPQWPSSCLVIYGPAGCGKTHLMHVWLARSHGQELSALSLADHQKGDRDPTQAEIWAIDNTEAITGHAAHEEALFHLYNRVREAHGFLLLTAQQAPAQWGIHLPDLKSRLLSVPAIAIKSPDDALLTALLIKQFRDRQIDVSTEVIHYLLPRVTRSPEAVRQLVTDLDHASLAEGRRISIALVKSLISF